MCCSLLGPTLSLSRTDTHTRPLQPSPSLTVESTFAFVSVADPTISRQREATDHAPSPLAAAILIIADDDVGDRRFVCKGGVPGTTKADTDGSRTRNTESLMVLRSDSEQRMLVGLKKKATCAGARF